MSRRASMGGGTPSQPDLTTKNLKRFQTAPPQKPKQFARSFSIQPDKPKKSKKSPRFKVHRRIPSKADVEAFRKRAEVVFNRLAPDGTLPVHSIKTSLQSLGFKVVEDAGRAINELQHPIEICDMKKGAKITTLAVLRMQARILLCRPEYVGIIMYIM